MMLNKISAKWSILIIIVILVLFLPISLFIYRNSVKSNLSDSSLETLENIMEQQRFAFDAKLQDQKNGVKLYANFFINSDFSKQEFLSELKIIAQNSAFDQVAIATPNGEAIESTGLHLDVSDRDYFWRAMTGETVISNPILSKMTARDAVVFATPIVQQGKVVAVLIGIYDVQRLSDMLLPSFDGNGYTYITTNGGNIIVKTQNSGQLSLYNNLFDSLMVIKSFKYDNFDVIIQNVSEHKSGYTYYSREGEYRLMNYAPVGTNGWYIFSVMPESAITAQTAPIMHSTYFLAGAIVLIFLLLLMYIALSRKSYMKELFSIAFVDSLTGAANRKKFQLTAAEILATSCKSYVVIIMDIDKFKVLNDTLGYACGDKLLVCIANVIKQRIHDGECFGRCDSDEYYLLLEYDNDESIEERTLAIINEIEYEFTSKLDSCYNLVLCAGVYVVVEPIESINVICDRAKHAQQLIKGSRISRVSFYNEDLRNRILREKQVENKMYDALENGDFILYLQPKYDLDNEKICGAEALVRWNHGDTFILYPDQFIPVFEKNGFITKLDFYMLEKACSFIRGWLDSGISPVPISINFSRLHLSNQDFVDDIACIVKRYQIPAYLIEVELTESTMLDNESVLISVLSHLHEHGFTLSMDDFGSGYSSLGLLKNLPVDTIKLDRTFFTQYNDIRRAKTVISSIISMAKKLGIYTVAEGVETREHIDLLIELGCDIVQGYYFAKPMPAVEINMLLSQNRDPDLAVDVSK